MTNAKRGVELEIGATSQQLLPKGLETKLAAPYRYLSSVDVGWEGLLAEAFYEPTQLERWITAPSTNTALILFAGGALTLKQRPLNGSWRTQNIHDGELILRPSVGTLSEVAWQGLSANPTYTLHIHLSKDILSRTTEEMTNRDPARLSLIGRIGFRDPLLMQIGLTLWRELEQRAPAGKLYAETAAQLLAVHLVRHYLSPAVTVKELSEGLTPRQVKRVRDFVLSYLSHNISLGDMAVQAGFSPYHFARLFRQTTGESPHQFVLRQRIETARRLLKETDMPLAHIALECGFANQSHLTRVFKRQFGLTPRTYRQAF